MNVQDYVGITLHLIPPLSWIAPTHTETNRITNRLKLTPALIRAKAEAQSFARGQALYDSDALTELTRKGDALNGLCEGSQAPFYQVKATLDAGGVASASCSSPFNFPGYCKHIVALLLAFADDPQQFTESFDIKPQLAQLNREQLLSLFDQLLADLPEMNDWLSAVLAEPSEAPAQPQTPQAKPAKPRRPPNLEPHRKRIRGIMSNVGGGSRGYFEYGYAGGLVSQLDEVVQTAREFLEGDDAETALGILLALLDETNDAFERVDDSDGELGDFFDSVAPVLTETILSLELDDTQRDDLDAELDTLHGGLDDYGVSSLTLPLKALRLGWEAALEEEDDEDEDEFSDRWRSETDAQKLTRAQLNVLARQGRTEEYLALCERAGEYRRYAMRLIELDRVPEAVKYALKHLRLTKDAYELAQQLRVTQHLEEAIKLGEHGLTLHGEKAELGNWLAPIEEAQGRMKEALAAWETAFKDRATLAGWQSLERLSGKDWPQRKAEWRAAIKTTYDHHPHAEILLYEKDYEAVTQLGDQHPHDYRLRAQMADAVVAHRPEWVIQISISEADKLIAKTQSKYYAHAADWLRRGKAGYAQLDKTQDWQAYLRLLKEKYRRRSALMPHLNKL